MLRRLSLMLRGNDFDRKSEPEKVIVAPGTTAYRYTRPIHDPRIEDYADPVRVDHPQAAYDAIQPYREARCAFDWLIWLDLSTASFYYAAETRANSERAQSAVQLNHVYTEQIETFSLDEDTWRFDQMVQGNPGGWDLYQKIQQRRFEIEVPDGHIWLSWDYYLLLGPLNQGFYPAYPMDKNGMVWIDRMGR